MVLHTNVSSDSSSTTVLLYSFGDGRYITVTLHVHFTTHSLQYTTPAYTGHLVTELPDYHAGYQHSRQIL